MRRKSFEPSRTPAMPNQTFFLRVSITVQLTSCLTGLDWTKQVNLFQIQYTESRRIQTNKTGQPWLSKGLNLHRIRINVQWIVQNTKIHRTARTTYGNLWFFEPWFSGYGSRLMVWRRWVWNPSSVNLMDIFVLICF